MSVYECIDILKLAQKYNDSFAFPPSFITHLITKCDDDLSSLQFVHSVMTGNTFKLQHHHQIDDNIILQTALINGYGRCGDVNAAQKVFESIADDNVDIICIGAMMTALVHNGRYSEALVLFDDVSKSKHSNSLSHDIVTRLLGIKSCTESGEFEKGRQIINEMGTEYFGDVRMVSAVINFYANCLDLDAALNIFHSVAHRQRKNVAVVGSMMDAFCKSNRDRECLELYQQVIGESESVGFCFP